MYPKQYQDFLDFIDRNPEYRQDLKRRLLTQELMDLPEQFARLVKTVQELRDAFYAFAEKVDQRLNVLENDVSGLKQDVSVLKQDMIEVKADVSVLKQDMIEVKADVSVLKQDMIEVKADVSVLKQDMIEVKADVSVLKQDMTEVKADVAVLKDDVAALKGDNTERRARESILNIAKDHLNLVRGRVLLAGTRDTNENFRETLEKAETEGLITPTQVNEVMAADIIIQARKTEDLTTSYAVFEVSRTIRFNDLERARKRADTVAQATGQETIAAVVGGRIRPPQQIQAENLNVQVVIPAMFRQSEEPE